MILCGLQFQKVNLSFYSNVNKSQIAKIPEIVSTWASQSRRNCPGKGKWIEVAGWAEA